MFNLSIGASDEGLTAPDSTFLDETVGQVRVWLGETSTATDLIKQLPALELALAAYVKNHDTELLALVSGALERISSDTEFETVENVTLAGLIGLQLRMFLLTDEGSVKDAAEQTITVAKARFDEQEGFFKVRAADTSKRFDAQANALLGEVFYFAWRVLDDQTLRPIAGEMLGQVSAFFDPAPRFTDAEPSDIVTNERERQELAVIAAAMQLFMTAGETTGRRSYLPRAAIVADAALENLKAMHGDAAAQADFASALVRLTQFTGEAHYSGAARSVLQVVASKTQASGDAASVALAVANAEQFPLHIVIVGDVENDANAKALWLAAMCEYAPTRVLEVLHPTQHAVRIAQLGYSIPDSGAAAFVCAGAVCLPPTGSMEGLRNGVRRAQSL